MGWGGGACAQLRPRSHFVGPFVRASCLLGPWYPVGRVSLSDCAPCAALNSRICSLLARSDADNDLCHVMFFPICCIRCRCRSMCTVIRCMESVVLGTACCWASSQLCWEFCFVFFAPCRAVSNVLCLVRSAVYCKLYPKTSMVQNKGLIEGHDFRTWPPWHLLRC